MEHEMAVVVVTADGTPVEVPPAEIVGADKYEFDDHASIDQGVFAMRLPPIKSRTRRRVSRAPREGPSDGTGVDAEVVPETAASVLSNFAGYIQVSEGHLIWLGADDEEGDNVNAPLDAPYESAHAHAAQRCAERIATRAREAGVSHATGSMHGSRRAAQVSLFLFACPASRDALCIDDANRLAKTLASVTHRYWHAPRRRGPRSAPRGRRKKSPIEVDSGFVEVRSDAYKRATIDTVAAEVVSRERDVLALASKVVARGSRVPRGGPHLMPCGGAVHVERKGELRQRYTYGGSYHVWITMPHLAGPAFDHSAFIRDHAAAVRTIQWLEPLIHACMPSDPRSPGSGHIFSRASMRSRLNHLNGLGVAQIEEPERRPVLCYESLEALNNGERPKIVRTDAVWLTTKSGARINILACTAQGRWGRADGRPTVSPLDGAAFAITQDGTDVRFQTCSECEIYSGSGDVAFVLQPASTGGDTVEVVVRMPLNGRSKRKERAFKFAKRTCLFEPRGIEARLFDQMGTRQERAILGLVVLAAVAGLRAGSKQRSVTEDNEWIMAMYDCSSYGSRVPVSRAYVKRVAAALGVKTPTVHPESALAALNALLSIAHDVYKDDPVARRFGYSERVVWPDVNFPNWKRGLEAKLAADPEIARALKTVIRSVALEGERRGSGALASAIDKHLGPDWARDVYMIDELTRS